MAIWYLNYLQELGEKMADDVTYHTYQGNDEYGAGGSNRKAIVKRNKKGFYVILSEDGLRVDKISCYDKSEQWAEDVAENYVLGILNP